MQETFRGATTTLPASHPSIDTLPHEVSSARELRALGLGDDAARLLLRAAASLEGDGRWDEALACYDEAISSAASRTGRIEGLDARASAATRTGQGDAAAWWPEVIDGYTELGDAERFARATFYQQALLLASRDGAELRDVAGQPGGWSSLARAYVHSCDGDHAAAAKAASVAVRSARARAHADRELEALALRSLSNAAGYSGDIEGATRALRRSADLMQALDMRRWAVRARLDAAELLGDQMLVAEALDECRAAMVAVEDGRLGSLVPIVRAYQALALWRAGRIDHAVRACALLDGDDADYGIIVPVARLVVAIDADGSTPMTRALLDEVTARVETSGFASLNFEVGFARMRLSWMGDRELVEPPTFVDEPVAMSSLAVWCARSSLEGVEPRIVELAQAAAAAIPRDGLLPLVSIGLEEVAATIERDVDALARVAVRWRDAGRRLDALRCEASLARVASDAGNPDAPGMLLRVRHELEHLGALAHARAIAGSMPPAPGAIGPLLAIDATVLRSLPQAALLELARTASVRELRTREVADPWDSSTGLVVVLDGSLHVVRDCPSVGRPLTIALLEPGDCWGESSTFGTSHDGTRAVARSKCSFVQVPAAVVREVAVTFPQLGRNLLQVCELRARAAIASAERLAYWPARTRVVRTIIDLDDSIGHPTIDGRRMLRHALTQSELASMAGTRREYVNEILQELQSIGAVEMRSRRLVIHDRAMLEEQGTP